ncbi:hypothetical protein FHR81_004405 [Actinoalloteichus hoggarensis]|uniref:Uncharacterized protein n=1 Tax=Actinoalloteichus hoggarensis TaxID=1470176 RepID=A0A221W9B0_9PSEU|nr:hypothetical protein [Actinoalloteichus hoggarensis]ASO22241.1 hypothetical protein AHOG_23155 [Actinoalloteichus hoggarensis]MBB5923338.1 hypothetical protein [Actinoalloteichus hoggarensis]
MPIRTNRGRAAVYRRLWGWPMRSPRHLIFAVVLLALLVTGMGVLLPEQQDAESGATVDPTSTAQGGDGDGDATDADLGDPRPGSGDPTAPSTTAWEDAAPPSIELTESGLPLPPEEEGIDVAREWGAAWLSHEETSDTEEWLARLAPFTTEERLAVMSSVDPRNIPFDEITGEPELSDSDDSTLIVLLPTDTQPLELTLIVREGEWRVSAYDQVSA